MRLPRFSLIGLLIWAALCVAGGAVVAFFSNLSLWVGAAITAAALLINSIVAEVEDNSPGGFNNPVRKNK